MVLQFMVYAVLTAGILGLAGWIVERALRQFGQPARWVWVVALVGGVALPAFFLAAPYLAGTPSWLLGGALAELLYETAAPLADARYANGRIDTGLLVAWVVLTVGGLTYLTWSTMWLAVARRRWASVTIAGFPVVLSDDVGPAVAGGEIVVPRWTLGVERQHQRLMLAHEQEHLDAGDPCLIVVVVAALIAMPWNVGLWFVARRLRLAVEVDCDARVLRRVRSDVGTYGNLLLEVGRRTAGLPLPAASFSRPRSQLEHRILAMTSRSAPAGRVAHVIGAAGVVVASLGFVWMAPQPIYGFCREHLTPSVASQTVAPRKHVILGVTAGVPRVVRTLPPAGG